MTASVPMVFLTWESASAIDGALKVWRFMPQPFRGSPCRTHLDTSHMCDRQTWRDYGSVACRGTAHCSLHAVSQSLWTAVRPLPAGAARGLTHLVLRGRRLRR